MAKPNDTSFSISIHALRKEGDRRSGDGQCRPANFYPRPPRGGRPAPSPPSANSCKSFLSTPSARRATDLKHKYNQKLIISIHALREEGDGAPHPAGARTQHFYPRPPRGGRPACASMSFITVSPFLSTPSARRATQQQQGQRQGLQISIHALREEGDASYHASFLRKSYFYPRPPRGGRQGYRGPETTDEYISIHALREEGDQLKKAKITIYSSYFYPRPPRGGRPRGRGSGSGRKKDFYPRPPRGGRPPGSIARGRPCDFYPRPPRGGRLQRVIDCVQLFQFLSTPSARRATVQMLWYALKHPISIHALREEGDLLASAALSTASNFYPRPPRGGRLVGLRRPVYGQ